MNCKAQLLCLCHEPGNGERKREQPAHYLNDILRVLFFFRFGGVRASREYLFSDLSLITKDERIARSAPRNKNQTKTTGRKP